MQPSRFRALLIGNSVFEKDPHNLPPLKGPPNDLKLLHEALTHDEVGVHATGNVTLLLDRTAAEVKESMEDFCSSAGADDQLLFYYTGHGRQDLNNNLYLCARDTRTDRLIATGIADSTINEMLRNSRASRSVIILDCCHSGSFKGGGLSEALRLGTGRFLLTSCRGQTLSQDALEAGGCSAFTRLLVEGLLAAEADTNRDAFITIEEVYNYLLPKLVAETGQIPQRHFDRAVGDVPIGKARPRPQTSPPFPVATPAPPALPAVLAVSQLAIEHRQVRLGDKLPVEIVDVYNQGGGELHWAATTEESWIQLEPGEGFVRVHLVPAEPGTHRGNIYVRDRGRGGSKKISVLIEVLPAPKKPKLEVTPSSLEFGEVHAGAKPNAQTIRLTNHGGGPLPVQARATTKRLRVIVGEQMVTVEPETREPGSLAGEIVIESEAGTERVAVTGEVTSGPLLRLEPGKMLDFGDVAGGAAAHLVLRVSNAGRGELTWTHETAETFFQVERRGEELRVSLNTQAPGLHLGALLIRSSGGEATVNVRARVVAAAPPPLPPTAVPPIDLSGWWMDQNLTRVHITGSYPNFGYNLYNAFGVQIGSGTVAINGYQTFWQGTAMFMPFVAQAQMQNPGFMSGTVTSLGVTTPLLLARSG